jgi:hypothetical protein
VPWRGEYAKSIGDEIAISDKDISTHCSRRCFFEESTEQNERAEFGDFFAQPRAQTPCSGITSEKRSIFGCVVNRDPQLSFQFGGARGVVVVPMGQKYGS